MNLKNYTLQKIDSTLIDWLILIKLLDIL